MKLNIDFEEIKKEVKLFMKQPKEKVYKYGNDLAFGILKLAQGLIEKLDYKLTMELDSELTKRESNMVTSKELIVDEVQLEPLVHNTVIIEPKESESESGRKV